MHVLAQRLTQLTGFRPILTAFAEVGHRRVINNMKKPERLDVPVISVGNITFGGTSKTPMVEYLARLYAGRDQKPGIVTRGYLGNIDRKRLPPELVSDGERILLEWTESGDEARQLAESLMSIGVPVAVGRDRISASKLLIEKFDVDLIILDDGYQFSTLHRDVDLVLIDALAPFGRFDLEDGILREPVGAMSRASAIILTHTDAVDETRIDAITDKLRQQVQPLPTILKARTMISKIRCHGNGAGDTPESLSESRVTAFAGIANPLGFEKTIESTGCSLTKLFEYPDHHSYRRRDINRIGRYAENSKADFILTTAKDAVRLNGHTSVLTVPLRVVEIEIEICEGYKDKIFNTGVQFKRSQ
jgi:tetraacyldisaccharide 4'-kinase